MVQFYKGTQSRFENIKPSKNTINYTTDTGRLYVDSDGTTRCVGEDLFKQTVGGGNSVSCSGYYISGACFWLEEYISGSDEYGDILDNRLMMSFTVTSTQPQRVTVYDSIDDLKTAAVNSTANSDFTGQAFITNDKHYDFCGNVTSEDYYFVDYEEGARDLGYNSYAEFLEAVQRGEAEESDIDITMCEYFGTLFTVEAPFESWVDKSSDLDVDDYSIVILDKTGPVDFFKKLGGGSIAVGNNCKTLNRAAAAIGRDNIAAGQYSVVFGRENEGSYASFVSGRGNKGRGYYSLVAGNGCTVEAIAGVAAGRSSVVDGAGAGVALGQSCKARACGAVALGSNVYTTLCNADGSDVSDDVSSYSRGQVVVGRYNADPGANVFVVGVGSKKTPKNALTIDQSSVKSLLPLTAAKTFSVGGTTPTGARSVSFGGSNTVSGQESFAGGHDCTASGDRSFAFGYSSQATSTRSIAIGQACVSTNTGSVAMGSNLSTGTGSRGQCVVGRYNDATELNIDDVFVVGGGTATVPRNALRIGKDGSIWRTKDDSGNIRAVQVKGTYEGCAANAFIGGMIATGESGGATGAQSFAYGTSCLAKMQSSIALGQACKALGLGSAAIGSNVTTTTNVRGQVVVGRYNEEVDEYTLFAVGTGDNASNKKTTLFVEKDDVNIDANLTTSGTISTLSDLTVDGDTQVDGTLTAATITGIGPKGGDSYMYTLTYPFHDVYPSMDETEIQDCLRSFFDRSGKWVYSIDLNVTAQSVNDSYSRMNHNSCAGTIILNSSLKTATNQRTSFNSSTMFCSNYYEQDTDEYFSDGLSSGGYQVVVYTKGSEDYIYVKLYKICLEFDSSTGQVKRLQTVEVPESVYWTVTFIPVMRLD